MGLLDEAIRDHLELKRRRGADPSEVARAEREALEPVFAPEELDGAHNGAQEGQTLSEAQYDLLPGDGFDEIDPSRPVSDGGGLAEETVEIDMQAVLDADAQLEAQAQPAAGPVRAPLPVEEESLEWELPDHATAEPPPDPLPGQEHLPFE